MKRIFFILFFILTPYFGMAEDVTIYQYKKYPHSYYIKDNIDHDYWYFDDGIDISFVNCKKVNKIISQNCIEIDLTTVPPWLITKIEFFLLCRKIK